MDSSDTRKNLVAGSSGHGLSIRKGIIRLPELHTVWEALMHAVSHFVTPGPQIDA